MDILDANRRITSNYSKHSNYKTKEQFQFIKSNFFTFLSLFCGDSYFSNFSRCVTLITSESAIFIFIAWKHDTIKRLWSENFDSNYN